MHPSKLPTNYKFQNIKLRPQVLIFFFKYVELEHNIELESIDRKCCGKLFVFYWNVPAITTDKDLVE